MRKNQLILALVAISTLISCDENQNKEKSTKEEIITVNESKADIEVQRFINPPIKNISIPFTENTVNAQTGDTLFYNTGSFVIFPPNSFIDENGNIIKGDVKVLFKEFNNSIDFFLSGIPMNYDSSGVSYNFESMGMLEISATQNDIPLQVNPESSPTINIASKIKNGADNYYYLDTINEKWVYKDKTVITDVLKTVEKVDYSSIQKDKELIKPRKKTERPSFYIIIEPGSLPELSVFDNLTFEITENEKNYKPEYGDIKWENVSVVKGKTESTYDVTFSKGKRKVTFETWPVLSDEEYEKAIIDYKRLKKESDRKRDSINASIEEEIKKIEEYNAIIKAYNDSLQLVLKKQKNVDKFFYSKFNIDRFGVWNCDNPVLQNGPRLLVNIKTRYSKDLDLKFFSVIYSNFNGIVKENNSITVVPEADITIIATKNSSFYLMNGKEINNSLRDTLNNTIQLKMTENLIPDNYEDFCALVESNNQ